MFIAWWMFQDQAIGYICYASHSYGPGNFRPLLDRRGSDFQGQRWVSTLLNFLEGVLEAEGGRLILAGTPLQYLIMKDSEILSKEWVSRGSENSRLLSSG